MRISVSLACTVATLAGCSPSHPDPETFSILAKGDIHRTLFDVQGSAQPSNKKCVIRVQVWADFDEERPAPGPHDDAEAVRQGFYWRAFASPKVRCLGALPVRYGEVTGGRISVAPMPLRAGASYGVAIALAGEVLGVGHFRVLPDGSFAPSSRPVSEQPR